ncbi:nitroreductase family deazaflavin-dependent oxidoreductase [Nocardioides sp. Kera G14]|uniref:nitroreductase family deazaflavin-dependent oxidoreductase n=1 Tax=Nocardioides sp. Kera G14 TaxID=2884264 RepID=UPI001D1227DA|nr:nitroreductase family deazaflavin-dependent oxidoreductase [Nocardioides sp. Kera G14]UDY22202.1 nitroreductase family deazaflavin-dependent oxidoreductase [Nocardioides sp. Kera G14]
MPLSTERPPGLDSPWATRLIKYGAMANTAIYRLTRGRLGGSWRIMSGWKKPVPILLLDHVGRKSGKSFTAPLVYLEDDDRLIVVASQGGMPGDPQWVHNLMAQPDTTVQIGGDRRTVRARVATAEERAELWPRMTELYADFDTYQAWATDRQIKILILEPR